jgi:uncharacterized membrane protein
MWVQILFVVTVFLVLAVLVIAIAVRRPRSRIPPTPVDVQVEELNARRELEQAVDARGSELIERRVELDARRGTLGGDVGLERALDELYKRLEAGEISEQDFEAQKVRLLGG